MELRLDSVLPISSFFQSSKVASMDMWSLFWAFRPVSYRYIRLFTLFVSGMHLHFVTLYFPWYRW